jgi:hypothetical protein
MEGRTLMAAKTVTTREFVCDRCGDGEAYANDADAGQAGWALLNINGRVFALCAEHYDELKRFLNVDTLGGPPNTVTTEPGYGTIMGTGGGHPLTGITLTNPRGENLTFDEQTQGWVSK